MDFSLKCQSYARAEAASKSWLPGSFAWQKAQALQGLSLALILSLCCLSQCQCRGIAWQLSLSLFLSGVLSLLAALLLVACSTAKSRAAIEGISLPVCRFCRSVSLLLSLPLSHHFIALSLSLPLSSFALNTLARQCDAFVMKRISGIRCLCVGNLGVSTQLCPTWLRRVVVEEVP